MSLSLPRPSPPVQAARPPALPALARTCTAEATPPSARFLMVWLGEAAISSCSSLDAAPLIALLATAAGSCRGERWRRIGGKKGPVGKKAGEGGQCRARLQACSVP